MLSDEIAGFPFNKVSHNRASQSEISRSRGSIEFKLQNISAEILGLEAQHGSIKHHEFGNVPPTRLLEV